MRAQATLRFALLAPLVLTACVSAPSYAQTDVIIRQAPPAERVEIIPAQRAGYAWDRGHWRWERGAYAWMPGHWQPVMHNARWEPGHWQSRGPNWYWREGHWVR